MGILAMPWARYAVEYCTVVYLLAMSWIGTFVRCTARQQSKMSRNLGILAIQYRYDNSPLYKRHRINLLVEDA